MLAFSISSVLTNGMEGDRSREAMASPGLFSILVNDGGSVTGSRQVRLGLEAPTGTVAVEVGTSPDLSNAVSQSYQRTISWLLDDGDGEKLVYARFIDGEGNPSEIVSDGIRLDTVAEIAAFGFDGSEQRVPGDGIVFTLEAGEPAGVAEVEVPRGGSRLTMRDDGVAPDLTAQDGIYTLSYVAETAHQFVGAEIVGHFTDEAGNVALERVAARRLTIHAPPPALTLEQPTSADPQEITLSWSRVADGLPFASYRLYSADAPGVALDPARRLVREVASRDQTTVTDGGREPGKTLYYEVDLVDPQGFATPSNEVSGTPLHNEPPAPVVLDSPFAITAVSVSLSWSRSTDLDFSAYQLVRGEHVDPLSDPTRRILASISNVASTAHDDNLEIEQGMTYYYVVEVVDRFGATSASNVVSATIDDLFPAAVTLSAPDTLGSTTVGLEWTASTERDFQAYKLYRSETAGVGETDLLIATVTEAERTRWLDEGLQPGRSYYYRIYVRDKGAHATPSNEVHVRTAAGNPRRR